MNGNKIGTPDDLSDPNCLKGCIIGVVGFAGLIAAVLTVLL